MYYIHIVKRFRAHCGFYAIENKLLLLLLLYDDNIIGDNIGQLIVYRQRPVEMAIASTPTSAVITASHIFSQNGEKSQVKTAATRVYAFTA